VSFLGIHHTNRFPSFSAKPTAGLSLATGTLPLQRNFLNLPPPCIDRHTCRFPSFQPGTLRRYPLPLYKNTSCPPLPGGQGALTDSSLRHLIMFIKSLLYLFPPNLFLFPASPVYCRQVFILSSRLCRFLITGKSPPPL